MNDLNDVIQTAVDDARVDDQLESLPEDTSLEVGAPADAPVEGLEAPVEGAEVQEGAEAIDAAVPSPAARNEQDGPQFAMDKKLGIPSHTNGRENRIPYSRVKKIVENAEKPLLAKLSEIEPRIKDYEARLQNVAEFENVMMNDRERFLGMLATIPTYQPFFQAIEQMATQLQTFAQQVQSQGAAPAGQPESQEDPMPRPGEDGVYSEEGLQQLLEWNSRRTERRVTEQLNKQYEPVLRRHQQEEQLNQIIPQIERQISEARTWPMFKENEDKITEYLNVYPSATLESAYRAVVFPKLQASRDQMRAELMQELRRAPQATSAPARTAKPVPVPKANQSLEDIIKAKMDEAGLHGER